MPTLLASAREADHLADYADLDPAVLASLRTPADENALLAAVETQLTASANHAPVIEIPEQRRRARSRTVQRAA